MNFTRRSILAAAAATTIPAWRPALGSPLSMPSARDTYPGERVVIGQSAVFSGQSSLLGQEMALGMQAAFTASNRNGGSGAGGREVVLKSKDDGYEPDRCKANVQWMCEQGVFCMGGIVGTPTCLAALPILTQAEMPLVGPFTGALALREHRPWVYHIRASYLDEARTIVKQLTAYGNDARIAVFAQADSYGDAVTAAMTQALAEIGKTPVTVARVQRNSLNVREAAAQIKASNATGVAMGSVYGACAALIDALGPFGRSLMYCSVSFIGTSGLLKNLGPKAQGIGIAQVMPSPWKDNTPFVAGYQRAMHALGPDAELSYGSLEGYACGMTILEGIRRCGSRLTRQEFAAALEQPVDLGKFPLAFSRANHAPGKLVDLSLVDHIGKLRT